MDSLAGESPQQFSQRVQTRLAKELGVKDSEISQKDIDDWFSSLEPPPPPKPVTIQGPIIPPSEFDPSKFSSKAHPDIEVMVQQVTAVLPQAPHTVIRKDLMVTKNVDMTITNFLEGRIKYTPIPNLYETTAARLRKRATKSGGTANSGPTKPTVGKQSSSGGREGLFDSKGSTTSISSAKQRQLSLEEKKKLLIENARKRYIEKHGLMQTT